MHPALGPASSCAHGRQPDTPHWHRPRCSPYHPGSGRKPERPPCRPPPSQAWIGEGMPAAALWGADAWHRPKRALQHTGSASPSARASSEQGTVGARSLPSAAALRSSVRPGDRQGRAAAPWQPLHRLFQALFGPGVTPPSAGQGTAGAAQAGDEEGSSGAGRTRRPWPRQHGTPPDRGQSSGRSRDAAHCATKLAGSRQGSAERSTDHDASGERGLGTEGISQPSSAACVKHLFSQLSPALVTW